MKQISGQIDLFDYLKELETICKHSGHKCNKKELWRVADTLDELMCPHVCCRNCATKMCGARCNGSEEPETIHPVDIMDICDDAYCPVCGDPIDEFKWMDCERCPSCGARISWEPWHRMNDEDNLNLFGENWREKFGKNVKKTKETEK